MLPSLEEIARKRKALGMTQKELARISMVSQSFIAKLESGAINPSYGNVKAILDAMENLEAEKSEESMGRHLYHRRIVSVSPEDSMYRAAKFMKKHKIHQVPVFSDGVPVGSVTYKTITDMISKGIKDFSKISVKEVMEEAFPVVQANSPPSVVSTLLKHNRAVLITRKSKIVGIVTRTDFIKSIK